MIEAMLVDRREHGACVHVLRRLLEESDSGSMSQGNNESPSGDTQKDKVEAQDEKKAESTIQDGKESNQPIESKGNEVGDSKAQGESTEDVKFQAEIKDPGGENGQTQNQEEKLEENKEERKGSEERRENGGVDDKKEGNSGDAVQVVQETKESDDKIGSGQNQEQNQEQIKKDDTNEQRQDSGSQQSESQEQHHEQEDIKKEGIKAEEKVHEAETQKPLEQVEHKNEADSKNEEQIEEHKMEDNKEDADQQTNSAATPTEEKVEKKDDVKVEEETVKEPEATSQHKDDEKKVEKKDDVKVDEETVKEPEATIQHKDDENKVEDKKQEADQQNSSAATLADEKVESPSLVDAPKGPEVEEKEDNKVPLPQVEDKVDERKIESEKIENKETDSETREQEEKQESQSKIDQLQSSEHVTEKTQNGADPEKLLEDKKQEPTAGYGGNTEEKADLDGDQKKPEVQVDGQPVKDEKVEENPGNMETKEQDNSNADLKLDDPSEFHGSDESPQVEISQPGNEEEPGLDSSAELENDDDYHDIVQEFSNLPSKFHETANHVAQQLLPEIEKISNKSKDYFLLANQHMTKRFLPLIGEQYAPLAASLICYGLLLLPMALVIFLVERIRAIFSLQKVLLIANIYLAAYFASLVLALFVIGTEPILFVVQNSPSNFILVQLLQGAGYIMYLILQTANFVITCSDEAILAKLFASIQWLVATLVGLHYYVTVFHRAMAHRLPATSWKANAIYCSTFVAFCFFARIKQGKKEYTRIGDDTTDKKN
ncbi:hypothetical protein O6H91_01G089000 [Diphasiastrum complanatum]|uniref:Uncharacterized protein n=1 Tax=Diphasiastrum complanatum TaxID=34168 RepID=A0ACC2ET49_DIPCM|nr:hypothetical protein O6H91_01G089000 [Diphasiastrum complanatum]